MEDQKNIADMNKKLRDLAKKGGPTNAFLKLAEL